MYLSARPASPKTLMAPLPDMEHMAERSGRSKPFAYLQQTTEISILFSDVDMPGSMDGLELARGVAESYPNTGVIVGSGHRNVTAKDIPQGALFFSKPYDLPRLQLH